MILLESNQYPVRIVCQGHQRTVLEEIVDEAHCPKRTFNFKANAAAIKQAQVRFDPGTIERGNHLQTNNNANSTKPAHCGVQKMANSLGIPSNDSHQH
jgi:hypothetical protein